MNQLWFCLITKDSNRHSAVFSSLVFVLCTPAHPHWSLQCHRYKSIDIGIDDTFKAGTDIEYRRYFWKISITTLTKKRDKFLIMFQIPKSMYKSARSTRNWMVFELNFSAFSVSKTTLCLKKVPTFKLSVTLSNRNRFSKFLHCWKAH